MKKNIIEVLLQDYLADKSDVRLGILCANLNPDFKLGKKNSTQVKLLIDDWEKDRSASRLKILTQFIGSGSSSPTKLKVKAKKDNSSVPQPQVNIDSEYRACLAEHSMTVSQWAKESDAGAKKLLHSEIKRIEGEMDRIVRRKEKENKVDPIAQEKLMILKLYGDPADENSLAYKILNSKVYELRIKSMYDPKVMIKKLFYYNAVEPVEYSSGLVTPSQQGELSTWLIRRGGMDSVNQGQTTL